MSPLTPEMMKEIELYKETKKVQKEELDVLTSSPIAAIAWAVATAILFSDDEEVIDKAEILDRRKAAVGGARAMASLIEMYPAMNGKTRVSSSSLVVPLDVRPKGELQLVPASPMGDPAYVKPPRIPGRYIPPVGSEVGPANPRMEAVTRQWNQLLKDIRLENNSTARRTYPH